MSTTGWVGSVSEGAVLAQAENENFPVASRAAGSAARHLLAIYGFARLVDDVGDEADGDREAQLAWVDRQLDLIYAGDPVEHPLMRRLSESVAACALPEVPLRRLVAANRRDQVVERYETFDELLGYCQLSAAPVGELVLHVFGRATAERIALSDRICAGLQVVEHLQDVAEDYARGRVYLPQEDLRRFGCDERGLGEVETGAPLRAVVAFEAARAHRLLDEGVPLVRALPLRARLVVAGFVAGGRSALRALEASGFDVCRIRPRRSRRRLIAALPAAVIGR
jgi:squalene synthase HpnC